MKRVRRTCDYCGLVFSGDGCSPTPDRHYCCYGCYLVQRIVGSKSQDGIASWILIRLGAGAFLSMNVMMISLILYTNSAAELGAAAVSALRWAMVILSTPAVLILGGPFLFGALRDLTRGRFSTDALISTGSLAAYAVSTAHTILGRGEVYFDTATMLLLIVTVGRLLEAAAKTRTSKAVRELMDLAPATACVLIDGSEHEVPAGEVQTGDTLVVRPGERFPADGVILSGECMVEESSFTGESKPRPCGPGEVVYGGSVNSDGFVHVRATAVGSESLLSQMQEMVLRAQQEKAPIERVADRVSTVFVPVVWITAAGSAAYWAFARGNLEEAALSALAVLVVACPCALGLATPMATALAIGRAARQGVLVHTGEAMESLSRVSHVIFDKTGTLTTGDLTVTQVITAGGVDEEELLAALASLEGTTTHSIARAVVRYCDGRGIGAFRVSDVRTIAGRGVEGTVTMPSGQKKVTAGSLALLSESHQLAENLEIDEESTLVYAGWDGRIAGAVKLEDRLREEAADAVQDLSLMDVKASIVSGDLPAPTSRAAEALGIERLHARCSPAEKVEIVKQIRKAGAGATGFVGDGINDAPALAEADVGIAIGGGTDVARQAGDVVLIGDDLRRIPEAIRTAHTAYRIIRQNLFWAFGYNCGAMALAFFGYVHPLIAASAMVGSSLMVIGNSSRLLWNKDTD